MAKCIMIGCDLHDTSMLLKMAVDRGTPQMRSWKTGRSSRKAMLADLQRRAARVGAKRIVFAYEACGFGFRLHDELVAAGMECHVLAPSKMARSAKRRKRKTDEKDAEAILDIVRAHVLAGVSMPSVWIPDLATRDDREVVRLRLSVAETAGAAKTRIRGLPPGAAGALASLLRQVEWLWAETQRLGEQVVALSQSPRYAAQAAALCAQKGVGVLTAMVFLTEMGDLTRFVNRQQVGSFLGLVPSSHESGQRADRKGHITRQGPSRVRKVLCQAVWSRVRSLESERKAYDRLVARNPKHKKIAVVARMRVLGVVLWHAGLEAQQQTTASAA